jgi:cytochrome c biogenesis protein CcmG, thiol:disulfide interchange protein DsbE
VSHVQPPPEGSASLDAENSGCGQSEVAAANLTAVAATVTSTGRFTRPSVFLWLVLLLGLAAVAAGIWVLEQERFASRQIQVDLATALPVDESAGAGAPALPARLQTQAPDFTLSAIDGSQVKLSDLRGKVVLLNFWATWCPPCKAEMPDLSALQQEYGLTHDLVVIGIDAGDDSQAAILQFAQQNHLNFRLLMDSDDHVSNVQYSVRALPTSLIIDRTGKIRAQWLGQLSRVEMLARLQQVW